MFTADEDKPGKPPVVILSNGFWKRRFGSDPSVVGKSLTLNGNTFTIVGVMAADFVFNKEIMPAVNGIQNVDLLLPLPLNETARSEPRRGGLQRLRQAQARRDGREGAGGHERAGRAHEARLSAELPA